MKQLINFIQETYPSHEIQGKRKVYIISPEPHTKYITIAIITKSKYVSLMDKFLYQGKRGFFIRALLTTNKHVRVYLDEFTKQEVQHERKTTGLLRKRKRDTTTKG